MWTFYFTERGSDNSDHESDWEKQQLLKAGANAKVQPLVVMQLITITFL